MKRVLLAACLTLACGAASSQTVTLTEAQRVAVAQQANAQVRVNVAMNIFVPAGSPMSEQALAEQEKARRQMYLLATKECSILIDTIATDCRIETVNVNVHRQQGHQQIEGFNVNANMNFRVTLK